MNKYKVLVPNLAHRDDRWLVCAGVLIGQGVPTSSIERFIAHDGQNYRDSETIAQLAGERYGFSHFIHGTGEYVTKNYEGWDPYNYSYCWTYYDAWNKIACEPDGTPPTLLLQDDWRMTIDYEEIQRHVAKLYLMEAPFRILQYVGNTCDPEDSEKVALRETAVLGIQHSVKGTGDQALLLSPEGARDLVEYADEHPEHAPEVLMWHFARRRDQQGCYSSIDNLGDHLIPYFVNQFQDRSTPHGGKTTLWPNV